MSPRYAATLLLVAVLLGACTRAADSNAPDDTRGVATRIVTLAPHLAELVHVAGAGDQLVGVSAFSWGAGPSTDAVRALGFGPMNLQRPGNTRTATASKRLSAASELSPRPQPAPA